MHFTALVEPQWQITGWYCLFLLFLVAGMKSISLLFGAEGTNRQRLVFLFAPSLSFPSWQSRLVMPTGARKKILGKAILFILLMGLYYRFFAPLLSGYTWWQQAYLAVIPFWLLLETLQSLLQVIWPESGRLVPPVNYYPWASATIAEFWGKRWNRLFGDWLHQVCFKPLKKRPLPALALTFAASSLIHEILVSLPYWLVYRESVFGWMCGYFGLQYLAVLMNRKWRLAPPIIRRAVCWLAVLGPVPLVLNPGTLRIFHLIR